MNDEPNHGGDITGYQLRYGILPLDFSASLNPLGTPPAVLAAAGEALRDAAPYPDPLCRRLRSALSNTLDAPPEAVFCGNGAADVIYRLVHALRPQRALIPIPAFAEYEAALHSVDCQVMYHPLLERQGYRLDQTILEHIRPGLDLLFLCQPNNPTGLLAPPGLMTMILDSAGEAGTTVVVDECFLPFVDGWQMYTVRQALATRPHVFLLDSFTKIYAMAGLRLGFGVSHDSRLMQAVWRAGQPWPVSNVAQAAGVAALAEGDYLARSLALVGEERNYLKTGLARIGFTQVQGEANFLFFHSPRPDLRDALLPHGILIRDCANFPGLSPGSFRVAVRTRDENAQLLARLAMAM